MAEHEFHSDLPPQLLAVLQSHKAVFSLPFGMPPPRFCDNRIHLLPNTKPVNVCPYRYPYFQKNEIKRQVREMLDSDIIRQSQSPFSSPILLIREKYGSFRFCIDYRALNTATVPDHFQIPTADELFDELGATRFFTKLDLQSGYHQIRMNEDDIYKTAFRTHDGHFEFLMMPFGLTNAPSTYQAAMNAIFRHLIRKSVIVFFDDILVYNPYLDMAKAYDRVQWPFLLLVLERMGFPPGWVSMVRRRISSCWFPVLVNESPAGFFQSSRGLRQGDQLFPSLFVLVADYLSRSLDMLVASHPDMAYRCARRAPTISHLSYADDIIIFVRAHRESEGVSPFHLPRSAYLQRQSEGRVPC